MNETSPVRKFDPDLLLLAGLPLLFFLYHMLTAFTPGYGYFIDELYYLACARHPAFGYVDHPPLSIALLALNTFVLGDSIPALRFLPALAGAGTVFMTGLLTRQLGGSRAAVAVAALAVMTTPAFLLMSSFYSMNAFEPLICASILYVLIRLVQEGKPGYWLLIGLLVGIGLEMKHTIVVYAVAIVIGMLITPARRFLFNKWFMIGALVSGFILLPNLIWQYRHGLPSLEFYRNATIGKNIPTGPLGIFLGQMLFANPMSLPLWIGGLIYFFCSPRAQRFRFVGFVYLVLLGIMFLSHSSRPDRITAIYVILFAGGAVAIEQIKSRPPRRFAMAAASTLIIMGGILAAPIFTPILSPQKTKAYLEATGFSMSIEKGKQNGALPQWLADRLGWKELAAETARVYHALPPGDKSTAAIVSTSYGPAGALELYGPEFGLPRVFATHNNYHLWGPPPDSASSYICVSVGRKDLQQKFKNVIEAGVHTCDLATRYQRKIPIYVARGPKFSFSAEWPKFKIYQ